MFRYPIMRKELSVVKHKIHPSRENFVLALKSFILVATKK